MPTKPPKTTERGRPHKENKGDFIQITCVLRKATVEQLRTGADSKHFGEFLQAHLERYPPPTKEQYLSLQNRRPYYEMYKRKRIPVLMAATGSSEARRQARKEAREQARRERLTPKQRAWEDSIRERVAKTVQDHYAGKPYAENRA